MRSRVLAALLLPGCLEQEVTTTIQPDGSCERMVVIKADGPDEDKAIEALADECGKAFWPASAAS